MTDSAPLDEMVDGSSQVRPHWRGVFGTLFSLGHDILAERAQLLERAFAEDGIAAILPGEQLVNWRCDPIPLILSAEEFSTLETGLAQRARLIDALLADVYGPGTLAESGAVPAELIYGNPGFLRPLCIGGASGARHLQIYAADLMRGPDGVWRVLADRTDQARGLAYALENRRNLARIVPEIFQNQQIQPLRPFMESLGDSLRALAPGGEGGIALLSGGHADPLWFEHVLLARELSIGLVEPGDLTVRGGLVFLKTLRGLERIGVLWRRQLGNRMDPLELAHGAGPPGLLDAMREGSVAIVNTGLGFGGIPGAGGVFARDRPAFVGRGPADPQPGDVVVGRRGQFADGDARPGGVGDPPRHRWRLGAGGAHAHDGGKARGIRGAGDGQTRRLGGVHGARALCRALRHAGGAGGASGRAAHVPGP